jgi:hypothetical protein
VESEKDSLEAELQRLRQKRRTFCEGPEALALKLQIEELERTLLQTSGE